jgi:hypothetical protein
MLLNFVSIDSYRQIVILKGSNVGVRFPKPESGSYNHSQIIQRSPMLNQRRRSGSWSRSFELDPLGKSEVDLHQLHMWYCVEMTFR